MPAAKIIAAAGILLPFGIINRSLDKTLHSNALMGLPQKKPLYIACGIDYTGPNTQIVLYILLQGKPGGNAMRIERISETKMKFVLMHTDLEARDIKISEISHSSDKTQRLFKEIIQLAQDEGVFPTEGTPYLVEAMRVGVDCLAIVVTKINQEDLEKQYSLVPAAKGHCRYKRNGYIEESEYPGEDSHSIFSFGDLDVAASAAQAISHVFGGESGLYSYNSRYFLWILNETEDSRTTSDLDAVLQEFGQKHVSNELSKQYLTEHGSEIIAEDAVGKLSMYSAMM